MTGKGKVQKGGNGVAKQGDGISFMYRRRILRAFHFSEWVGWRGGGSLFMYRRPILCTLYGAVDFLNVLKKYIMYL